MGIDSIYFTSIESKRKDVARSRTPVHTPTIEGGLLK
ncbi:hypothetical protein RDI58_007417 [Solanum bulbocastanum]|uniref:Uncharacterized protein n=1 Tax=Solanum bulbocastanum TaxID=147425 RepID=A0AAN8TUZ2_SOLBU